jgi:uncharacterized membrane protein
VTDEATEAIHIDAPAKRCFEVAVDYEQYPEWTSGVKVVEVLDRGEEGLGQRVRYEISALGRTIGYTLHYDYADAPESLSWQLVQGDGVTRLDGSYRFEPEDEGTRVVYRLIVDLSVPMPRFMKRRATGMIVQNALKELKRYLETGPA